MDGNGDPLIPMKQEEIDEGASERQRDLTSQDLEKWKLQQEFKLRELEIKEREESKQKDRSFLKSVLKINYLRNKHAPPNVARRGVGRQRAYLKKWREMETL